MGDETETEEAPAPTPAHTEVRPPTSLLVLAGAAIVLSVALLLVPGLPAELAGYLLASLVAISLVGLFRRNDLRRRQSPHYTPQPGLTRWAGALALVGVVVAGVHTWSIATTLAK